MSNVPDGYNLIIDVAHHQGRIDYEYVARYIKGAIVRFSYGIMLDTKWIQHVNGFLAAGVPVAAYTWYRPDEGLTAQLDVARRQLNSTSKFIKLVFSDQEQHGRGGYRNLIPHYEQFYLSAQCRAHVTGLQTLGVRAGVYSRSTWIKDHCRPTVWPLTSSMYPSWRPWMYDYPTFLASYPFAAGAVYTVWESILDYWAPRAFSPYFTPDWPTKRFADIWQWSGDKFALPGIKNDQGGASAVDLGYASDYVLSLFTHSDQAPVPTPIPPDPPTQEDEVVGTYRTLVTGQNVRAEPNTGAASLGTVSANLTLQNPPYARDEINNTNSWRYFQNVPTREGQVVSGWIAFVHAGTQYLRREQ